jgi:SAM-dependent methyltransferase
MLEPCTITNTSFNENYIFVEVNEMKNYDITKQTYETNSDIFIDQWKDTNIIDNGKIETYIELLPTKAKILDIGAGFGKDVNYFCNKGLDCIGIDFCDKFIQKSKQLYSNVNIIKMSFLDIDFSENTFDGLWSRGSLFHLSKNDFIKVIKILGNILKPNGVFYIQLIEGNQDVMLERVGSVESPAHYSYYTENELKVIMNKYNFEFEKEYPVDGWLNHFYRLKK